MKLTSEKIINLLIEKYPTCAVQSGAEFFDNRQCLKFSVHKDREYHKRIAKIHLNLESKKWYIYNTSKQWVFCENIELIYNTIDSQIETT